VKKAFLITLAFVISIAFVTVGFAQGPTSSGQKEESTATGVSKKADKGSAPKAPKGGVKQESTPENKWNIAPLGRGVFSSLFPVVVVLNPSGHSCMTTAKPCSQWRSNLFE